MIRTQSERDMAWGAPRFIRLCCSLVFAIAGAGVIIPAAAQEQITDGPHYANDDDFAFTVVEYEANSNVDYDKGEIEHSIEMTGMVIIPEDEDVICMSETFTVLRAEDDDGKRIDIVSNSQSRSRGIERINFSPVLTNKYFNRNREMLRVAEVEIDETQLTRSAFTIDTLTIQTEGIFAKKREVVQVPAIVRDDATRTDIGVMIRLSSMKIDRKNKAEVVVEVRRDPGDRAPIPDALYAIDKKGNRIGGGRWIKAAPVFAGEGEFELEFIIDDDADVAHFELVMVTDFELKPIEFEVKDVFQE